MFDDVTHTYIYLLLTTSNTRDACLVLINPWTSAGETQVLGRVGRWSRISDLCWIFTTGLRWDGQNVRLYWGHPKIYSESWPRWPNAGLSIHHIVFLSGGAISWLGLMEAFGICCHDAYTYAMSVSFPYCNI